MRLRYTDIAYNGIDFNTFIINDNPDVPVDLTILGSIYSTNFGYYQN